MSEKHNETLNEAKASTEYRDGYMKAIEQIRQAMQGGGQGPQGPQGPPPDPRLKQPPVPQKGGGGSSDPSDDAEKSAQQAEQSADDAQISASEAQGGDDSKSSDRAQKAADKAKQAAKESRDAAEKAKDAQSKGDTSTAQREAKRAKQKADEAKQAAGEAKAEADKSNGKGASEDSAAAAQKASEAADSAAERAQKAADRAAMSGDKDAASKARKAADRARDEAKKAQQAADQAIDEAMNGNDAEAKKSAQEAITHAREAQKAASEANQEANKSNDANRQTFEPFSTDNQEGGTGASGGPTGWKDFGDEPSADYIKQQAEEVINKYARKITGAFGEFVSKCKQSTTEEKKEGMVVRQRKGAPWNKALERQVNAFIKQRVMDKHREFERTYRRIKRGSRPVKMGEPIQPGRKIKDDKLNITFSFYVDRSGSMGDQSVQKCFELAYRISDDARKNFQNDSVVGDIGMRYFAFDTQMMEIPRGKTVGCGGGTMSIDELMDHINTTSSDDLINVVITDSEFSGSIDTSKIVSMVKQMPGMFFFIVNNTSHETEFKEIERRTKGQFVFLLAGSDWAMG